MNSTLQKIANLTKPMEHNQFQVKTDRNVGYSELFFNETFIEAGNTTDWTPECIGYREINRFGSPEGLALAIAIYLQIPSYSIKTKYSTINEYMEWQDD